MDTEKILEAIDMNQAIIIVTGGRVLYQGLRKDLTEIYYKWITKDVKLSDEDNISSAYIITVY
jgi:hypothetical protein